MITISHSQALRIALSMYVGEPCRICGKMISETDVHTAVFAGYSKDSRSRAAHGGCWDNRPAENHWGCQ